jgi:hypothetical protein
MDSLARCAAVPAILNHENIDRVGHAYPEDITTLEFGDQ